MATINFDSPSGETCPICKGLSDEDSVVHGKMVEQASNAATKAARERADKEKKPGVSWTDLYMMYYRAAFEHEYRRRIYIEHELVLDKLIEKHEDDRKVCCYHSENIYWKNGGDDMDCEALRKELLEAFAKSKWPKPLQYNEKGWIGPR